MQTLKSQQFQRLREVFKGEILIDEPLNDHTTFRIGGPADFYVYPNDWDDLKNLLILCNEEQIKRFVIGNGSNLLVHDNGFRGIIINLSRGFDTIRSAGLVVYAGAGVSINDLLKYCVERGLSGMEPLIGIPGQIGGAICLNAGAWDMEISNNLLSVEILDEYGTEEKINHDEIEFGYRYTDLPEKGVIVGARFQLKEGNPREMAEKQRGFMKKRKEKQPLSLPSAGSIFKSPTGNYAGRLIEEAGCKGIRIGDAMVSKKHANFIVNVGNATAVDVVRVIEEVKKIVLERFDIQLETEIHQLGFEEGGGI